MDAATNHLRHTDRHLVSREMACKPAEVSAAQGGSTSPENLPFDTPKKHHSFWFVWSYKQQFCTT